MSDPTKALVPTPVSESITAIFRNTPFNVSGDYHEVQVPAGLTIQEIIDRLADAWKQPFLRVILNDEIVSQDQWALTVPHKDDVLNIILVPQSGDAGAIFKAIAVIAVVVAIGWALAPVAAGGLGLFGLTNMAVIGGIAAIGGLVTSLALNALFPPPVATTPTFSGAAGLATDPAYGFSSSNNQLKPYSVIPRLYGRRFFKPDFAIKPYLVSSGSTQYLYQAYDLGYGPLHVEDIRIGDTPIENFTDVEWVVHESFQAGDPLQFINQDVWQDPYSIKLTQGASTAIESTDNAEKLVIDLQFPQGLFWVNSTDGNYNHETVEVSLKIRNVGTGNEWLISELSHTVEGATVSYGTLTVSRKTQKPFFVTVSINLPEPGKYEILPIRLTADRESRETNKSYDTVYLSSIQSIRNVAPIAPPVPITLIELRAKATDKFNGAIADLSCIATSKLPVYRNGAWVVEATSNPAWCTLSAMRGAESKSPIPDKRIILPDYIDWAAWCDADMPSAPGNPRACCDLVISGKTTQWDALQTIAATGYATPTRAGFRYTVAIDRLPTTPPVQMFLPENIKGLEGAISYHEQPHALRVQFSPTDSADSDEVVVFDDGYSADGANGTKVATLYETLDLVGIGRYQQAWVMGRRSLAQGRLRIEEWGFSVDYERMLCRRGSYVRFAHDLPMIGSGTARVTRVNGQTIGVSKSLELTGRVYCIIRTSQNVQKDFTVASYTDREMVLEGDVSAVGPGDTIAFGNISRVAQDCFVKSIRSAGEALGAKLALIPVAPGIYTADTEPIPAYEAMLPPQTGGTSSGGSTGIGSSNTTPGPVNGLRAGVFVTYNQGAPKISVSLSWASPVSGRAMSYKVYHYWNSAWQLRSTVYDTTALAYSEYTFLNEAGQPVSINGVPMVFSVVGVNGDGAALPPELGAQVTVTPQANDPATIETLVSAGGAFCINLQWALQTNGFDAAHVEIWGGQTNNREMATLMATPAITINRWQLNGLAPSARYYFWVRVVDGSGNKSGWYPQAANGGVAGQPIDNAQFLLDQLQGAVGLEQVAEEIARPLSLVDPIKFKLDWELGNVNIQKLAEKTFGDTERVHSTAQVITEAAARADGDEASAILIQEVSARLDTGDYAIIRETVEASASALQGITARYLLQVDANGHVAAVNLQSGDAGSSMVFLADKFLMAKPDGTGVKPLLSIGTVNGQEVMGFDGYLLGAGGTFTGNLQAANGTFVGELQAATGTFGGRLMAGVLDLGSLTGITEYRSSPGTYYFTLSADESMIRYQLIAGGGGGGSGHGGEWATNAGGGGGGGAGQYRTGTITLSPGAQIRVIVGSGGAGASTWAAAGAAGTYSAISYWNGSSWVDLVVSNPGGGGAAAPWLHWDNMDNLCFNGAGGSGYPAGEHAPDGNTADGFSARGGKGATTVWGIGGSPGYPNNGWGSPGSGYGSGGGGGSGYHAWRWSGSDMNRSLYGGGAAGMGGKAVIEFYNPNTVVLRAEFITVDQRVTAIEQRLQTAGIP